MNGLHTPKIHRDSLLSSQLVIKQCIKNQPAPPNKLVNQKAALNLLPDWKKKISPAIL
jgi:hypothetical protein